ncbi:hypothetical protein GGI20_005533, partial [Coemansia sp. BCRC 34301]
STTEEVHVIDNEDSEVLHTDHALVKESQPGADSNSNVEAGVPKPLQPMPLSVAFKNGKLSLSEKKLGLERHPAVVAAIFQFHQLVAQLGQDAKDSFPLTSIPGEYWCLVAMLVQERDASMPTLVRSIESQLCPVVFGEKRSGNSGILAPGAVEAAVTEVAELHNYGVSLASLKECCGVEIDDVPHRWEVRDMLLFPEDVREVVLRRRRQRQDAHSECAQWFQTLDEATQAQALAGTLKKLKPKLLPSSSKQKRVEHAATEEASAGEGASAKRVHHVLRGQKSLQNFFASERGPGKSDFAPTHSVERRSYYQTAFLPFHVRQNTTMYRYEPPVSFDCNAVDRALSSPYVGQTDKDSAASKDASEHYLKQFMSASRHPLAQASESVPDCNIVYSNCNGDTELDEAELYLMRLRKMPMKLFHFHGSRRPDYWGTWSRRLYRVSARRPFSRDTAELDYDVDSDAEWEGEEEGEDLRSEDDDDSDDDEDDDDFDEQSGFIVGDCMPRMDMDGQVLSDDEESGDDADTDEESNFNSEDEKMEDIDPSEEVCGDDDMDVDEPIGPASSRRRMAATVDNDTSNDAARLGAHLMSARPKPRTHDEKRRDHQPSRRAKVQPLTPLVVGLVWCQDSSVPSASALDMLTVRTIGPVLPLNISIASQDIQPMRQTASSGLISKGDGSAGAPARKARDITDTDLHALVGVVHGASLGIARLVEMLRPQIPGASKAQIERLIHENASKEKRPPATRPMWYVREQLVEQARASRQTSVISEPSPRCADSPAASVSDSNEAEESAAKRQRISEIPQVSL